MRRVPCNEMVQGGILERSWFAQENTSSLQKIIWETLQTSKGCHMIAMSYAGKLSIAFR